MILIGFLVFYVGLGIFAACMDYVAFEDMIVEYNEKYASLVSIGNTADS